MSAADRLRQAIEALPDGLRGHWTEHGRYVNDLNAGEPIATVDAYRGMLAGHGIPAYIALMDPTVGVALAELLRRLAAFRLMEHGTRYPSPSAAAAYDDVERASYALEQAIERSGQ